MSNAITDAVGAAMSAIVGTLSSITREMTAGVESGTVAVCSSVDVGIQPATSAGVNSTMRVFAKAEDFPSLAVSQPVTVDSSRHVIVGLKNAGGAAWFADLSAPLVPVVAKVKVGGTLTATTALCAIVDNLEKGTSFGVASTAEGCVVTVFIPFDEWHGDKPPAFGTRFSLPNGRTAVAQSVDRTEYSWRCEAVASMSAGAR